MVEESIDIFLVCMLMGYSVFSGWFGYFVICFLIVLVILDINVVDMLVLYIFLKVEMIFCVVMFLVYRDKIW